MKTVFTLRSTALVVFCVTFGYLMSLVIQPTVITPFVTTFIAAMLVVAAIMFWHSLIIPDEEPDVDIWKLQRRVMQVSGQRTGDPIQLNKNVLLYFKLLVEETAELGGALSAAIGTSKNRSAEVIHYQEQLEDLVSSMFWRRDQLTDTLSKMRNFTASMDADIASLIFDGILDVTVVAAGAALAGGFPANQGYLEVFTSNMSKVNPLTGKIMKTQDGKWIKGSNYRPPNLRAIIDSQNLLYNDSEF